jgi:hypothetical protein
MIPDMNKDLISRYVRITIIPSSISFLKNPVTVFLLLNISS